MTTQVTHHVQTEKRDPYYSSHQCDCGCGQWLPQKLYDLGWRYLRGHKAVGGPRITKPTNLGHRAPRTTPGVACNWVIVEKFVSGDLELRRRRMAEITERLPVLEAEVQALRAEQETLARAIDERSLALAMLLPSKGEEGGTK